MFAYSSDWSISLSYEYYYFYFINYYDYFIQYGLQTGFSYVSYNYGLQAVSHLFLTSVLIHNLNSGETNEPHGLADDMTSNYSMILNASIVPETSGRNSVLHVHLPLL